MRGVALGLALAVAGGCAPGHDPRVGQFDAQGQLIVGAGDIDGHAWQASVSTVGESFCSNITLDDRAISRSCESEPFVGLFGQLGMSGGTDVPTFVEGRVAGEVTSVVLHTSVGMVQAPAVPLAALNIDDRAFAVALPERTRVDVMVAFDRSGIELGREKLGLLP